MAMPHQQDSRHAEKGSTPGSHGGTTRRRGRALTAAPNLLQIWQHGHLAGSRIAMDRDALLHTLRTLEIALHQAHVRADAVRLGQLLHLCFRDFGRSGAEYSRAQVLAEFANDPPACEVLIRARCRRRGSRASHSSYVTLAADPNWDAFSSGHAASGICARLERW